MNNSPNTKEWKRLYQLAAEIKKAEPWAYMREDQLFCFIDPESQKPCMVSVMGKLGEHLSVTVYIGALSIHNILSVYTYGENERTAELILSTTQVQLSFENRNDIEKRDYQIIKDLGLKFRGRQAWPIFRGIWPSHTPFFIEQAEAKILICGLEQLLEVIPQFKNSPETIPAFSSGELLFRVQENNKWMSENRPQPNAAFETIDVEIEIKDIELLDEMPRVKNIIEIDSFINMAGIYGRRDERGVITHMLMVVDGESGMVLGHELLDPSDGMDEMWSVVPQALIEIFTEHEIVPETVWIRSPLIYNLCKPVFDKLRIEMKMVFELPMLDEAKMGLMASLRGGMPPGMLDMMQKMIEDLSDEFPDGLPDNFPTEFFGLLDED